MAEIPREYPKQGVVQRITKPGLANKIYQMGRAVGGAGMVYKQGAEDLIDRARGIGTYHSEKKEYE